MEGKYILFMMVLYTIYAQNDDSLHYKAEVFYMKTTEIFDSSVDIFVSYLDKYM